MRFPTSLTGRLIASAVALVTVVSLLVAVTATLLMRSSLMNRLDNDLHHAVERSQRFDGFGPGGGGFGRCGGIQALPPGQDAGSVTAIFGDGCNDGMHITISGELRRLSGTQLRTLAAVAVDGAPRTLDLPELGSYRVAATEDSQGSRIVFGLPTADVDDTITNLIMWEVLLSLLGIGLAVLVARTIIRRQLQPLREVAATAHEVADMPLSDGEIEATPRVSPELSDPATEVGQVGAALNQMLGHVENALNARHESEQRVRRFLADASHELRTPLTTIKGYAELSRRTGSDPAESLAKVESEVGRITRLVEDMLLLARLDSGRPLVSEEVDLTQLVVEAVTDAGVVDPTRRWLLEVPDGPVVVVGDGVRLHQAVTNLLTNAMRHTPEGTTVTARVVADPKRIEVHDDGPGISPDLLPMVWDRFSRGDSSRAAASGGVGLGTSLVRAIMAAHHGTAEVRSVPGSTTFTLTFG